MPAPKVSIAQLSRLNHTCIHTYFLLYITDGLVDTTTPVPPPPAAGHGDKPVSRSKRNAIIVPVDEDFDSSTIGDDLSSSVDGLTSGDDLLLTEADWQYVATIVWVGELCFGPLLFHMCTAIAQCTRGRT